MEELDNEDKIGDLTIEKNRDKLNKEITNDSLKPSKSEIGRVPEEQELLK